jgi:signal transduction histidine kinase
MPAIVGLFTVAALAYWGHLYRAAPEWVVVVAAVSAVGSLVLAWQNTRYVARRIERLAGDSGRGARAMPSPLSVVRSAALPGAGAPPDEIDSIEAVVDRLTSAVTVAEADSRVREAVVSERVQEYAVLLAEASAAVSRQLDEVRIPLHILLENHFGQLNENQEEMLEAARRASEAAELEVHRLREIAQLDRGALSIRRDQVRLSELLQSLRPQLVADGEPIGVSVAMDIPPGLPRVAGDRVRLQEAFELLLRYIVRHAAAGTSIAITAQVIGTRVAIEALNGPAPTLDPDIALARRVLLAHGATVQEAEGKTVVTFQGPLGS